jgi:hypothetical protein
MPLTSRQITLLVDELDQQWDLATLRRFASDYLTLQLDNLAPAGSLKQRALELVNHVNSQLPPRDRELLEQLRLHGNARLRQVAGELLTPAFFSPSNDPHDAILLGRAAFVDRERLRTVLRDFTNPSVYTTRVLVIRGEVPCGKSYSWEFLRHLASTSVGATAVRLRLGGAGYTPRQFVEQAFLLLGLDTTRLPVMTDDPQQAHIRPLVGAFMGQVLRLQQPYWLIVDDLNDPSVTPLTRETAYAIAYAVEDTRPANLWVALLGYNPQIIEIELRRVAQEDAQFPNAALLAEHFKVMAAAGPPPPLEDDQALEYAELLLSRYPELNKEAMSDLTPRVEEMGEKLRNGERPEMGGRS